MVYFLQIFFLTHDIDYCKHKNNSVNVVKSNDNSYLLILSIKMFLNAVPGRFMKMKFIGWYTGVTEHIINAL